jgi:protein-S-isoprenylcysteine O-methyltransferase Ste14
LTKRTTRGPTNGPIAGPTAGPTKYPAKGPTQVDAPPAAAAGHRLGQALVAAQLMLLAVLAVLGGPALLAAAAGGGWTPVQAAGGALVALGTALGAWALTANRPGNFRIHPAPHAHGRLVEGGPYRWIRHPMYSALLVAGAGCVLAAADAPSTRGTAALAGLAWFALAAVLTAKARLEERWLLAHHPGYAALRARTRRFVPGLF